jgi:hypothetical protein
MVKIKAIGKRHLSLIHRDHAHEKDRTEGLGAIQKLGNFCSKGVKVSEIASIGPSQTGGIIYANGENDGIRNAIFQFSPITKLVFQSFQDLANAIASDAQIVQYMTRA